MVSGQAAEFRRRQKVEAGRSSRTHRRRALHPARRIAGREALRQLLVNELLAYAHGFAGFLRHTGNIVVVGLVGSGMAGASGPGKVRSEEHTSELQSIMRISYAVFCLKKKNKHKN